MTKIRLLKTASLASLRKNVKKNLSRYRSGDFSYLENDPAHFLELNKTINLTALSAIKLPNGSDLWDMPNCLAVGKILNNLSPYEARDERLWVYATHTYLLDYARARWPIPDDDELAVAYILKHFYAKDKRQAERDNAGSRLWWMERLCRRIDGLTLEQSLQAFLYKSDVRASIIERPTSSQSVAMFGAIVKKLSKSLSGEKILFERLIFRKLMAIINSVGGFKLLDCLDESSAEELLDSIIKTELGLQRI